MRQHARVGDNGGQGWSAHPIIYEVNTALWLREVGARAGTGVGARLEDVPDGEWDRLVLPGAEAVWLMGVWERSPAGTAIAAGNPDIDAGCRAALPDYTADDFIGSPYCIRGYRVDERFGGNDGLAYAREALRRRGLKLMLDFVPNHVAPDHPWTVEHPEYFVRGTPEEAASSPEAWVTVGESVLARGRDPYFPPWPDVVQVDAFSPDLRGAAAATLADIAGRCDGVRCDMGMLMLDDVFASTWREHAGSPLPQPYWPEVIAAARAVNPGFRFMAEVYWDREPDLLAQGFDLVYDKRLYDRLVGGETEGVRAHLTADPAYQRHLVRFLENHDEPRAAAALGDLERERAAAVLSATVPGAFLLHEGQLEGRRTRLPVFLDRRPEEAPDSALHDFYARILEAVSPLRQGEWWLCWTTGWPDNESHRAFVASTWRTEKSFALVVVNLTGGDADGMVHFPFDEWRGRSVRFVDEVTGEAFERDGEDIAANGLYVRLAGWHAHILVTDAA